MDPNELDESFKRAIGEFLRTNGINPDEISWRFTTSGYDHIVDGLPYYTPWPETFPIGQLMMLFAKYEDLRGRTYGQSIPEDGE